MDYSIILKIAGLGLIISIVNQILSKNGREDISNMVSIAGILITLFLIIDKLNELIKLIESVFHIATNY